MIIFGRSVTEKVRNHMNKCFVFPPHLSGASALPCKIGNQEGSAQVHCACNTVQLLQQNRLPFSWIMSPTLHSWIRWLQDLESHTVVSVWVVSQKGFVTVEFRQCTNTAFEGKKQCSRFLQKHKLFDVAYWSVFWLRTLSVTFLPKKYLKICSQVQSCSKPKVGHFLRHGVVYTCAKKVWVHIIHINFNFFFISDPKVRLACSITRMCITLMIIQLWVVASTCM